MTSNSTSRRTLGLPTLAVLVPVISLVTLLLVSTLRWKVSAANLAGDVRITESDFESQQTVTSISEEEERRFFSIAAAITQINEKYQPVQSFYVEQVRSLAKQEEMLPFLVEFADDSAPVLDQLKDCKFKFGNVRFQDSNRYSWSYGRPMVEVSAFLILHMLSAFSQGNIDDALEIIGCHQRLMGPTEQVVEPWVESSRLGRMSLLIGKIVSWPGSDTPDLELAKWDVDQLTELRRLVSLPLAISDAIESAEINRWRELIRDGRQVQLNFQWDPFQGYPVAPSVRENLLGFFKDGRSELIVRDTTPDVDGLVQFPLIRFIPGAFGSEYRYSNSISENLIGANELQQLLLASIESALRSQEESASVSSEG